MLHCSWSGLKSTAQDRPFSRREFQVVRLATDGSFELQRAQFSNPQQQQQTTFGSPKPPTNSPGLPSSPSRWHNISDLLLSQNSSTLTSSAESRGWSGVVLLLCGWCLSIVHPSRFPSLLRSGHARRMDLLSKALSSDIGLSAMQHMELVRQKMSYSSSGL